jgi:hypothetical protein
MQLETAFVLAHIMNRTLVLPPPFRLPHQTALISVTDFWDIQDMNKAVRVLTSNQFCDEIKIPRRTLANFKVVISNIFASLFSFVCVFAFLN